MGWKLDDVKRTFVSQLQALGLTEIDGVRA